MPATSAHTADNLVAEEQFIKVKHCRNGLFMFNTNDRYIGRSLDTYGEFSEAEADLFRQILKPGMSVLDIGANIGVHTVTFAKLVGPGGRVFAYEPQPVVFRMLCGNLALNSLANVVPKMAALGKTAGSIDVPDVDFAREGNFGGISLMHPGEAASKRLAVHQVPLETIDSLMLGACHFIKIDVEGMEQDVIEGSLETLARLSPFLLVENDRWEKSAALIECLNRAGYRCYWHVAPMFNPNNYFGADRDIFGALGSINAFCVPRTLAVELKQFIEITPETATAWPRS